MSLRDFIYLDEGRLASFLAQQRGFVADYTSTIGENERAKARTRSDSSAELTDVAADRRASVSQGRSHDARWGEFLDELVGSAATMFDDDASEVAEKALAEGAIVRVKGTFFIDDFGGIQRTLEQVPMYLKLLENQQRAPLQAELATREAVKPPGNQRAAWDTEKQKLKAQLAAVSAQVKSLEDTFATIRQLAATFLGDGVECGVVLRTAPTPLLVRSVLDRAWLREPAPTLTERYGSRSTVGFTIIGIVTRLSWSEKVYVTPQERAGAAGTAAQDAQLTGAQNSVRGAVGAAQALMESAREQFMSLAEERAIFVAPLAIYREIAAPRPT